MVSKTIQGAGLFEIDFLAVADSDNEDDEAGFVSLEDHPIGSDAKSIKRLFGPAEPPDVVFQRGRILGQDEEFRLDNLLPGPVDFLEFIQSLI